MSQERMEVLRMVAEKLITVEEAERLLRAVDEGDRKREERAGRKPRGESVGSAFEEIGEILGSIGAAVPDAMRQALKGVVIDVGVAEGDLKDVPIVEGGLTIPAGTRLEIRERTHPSATRGGHLKLVAADDDERCTVSVDPEAELRAMSGEGRTRLVFGGGSLEVRVPRKVAEVHARRVGGDIETFAVACPVRIKTMGGDLWLKGVTHPFEAKTMGGAIEIAMADGLTGEGRAVTMGGDMIVDVPAETAVRIDATTMAGSIKAEPGLEVERKARTTFPERAVIRSGPEPRATVNLKTMGGSITVRRAAR